MDEASLLSELEAALVREAALLQGLEEDPTIAAAMAAIAAPPLQHSATHAQPMAITDGERDFALRLKEAIQGDEEIDVPPLNDMQYAHHALVDCDNFDVALQKIIGLQTFRQTYGIKDTVEQGMYFLEAFMSQQSTFVLHLDVCDDNNGTGSRATFEAIRVLDVARLNPSAAMAVCPENGADHNWKIFVCGLYYMHTACSPYLSSIRQGIFEIADLDSFGSKNFNMEFEYRRHGELIGNYPLKFKTIMAYNTGYWANVSWNLMKPLMNDNVKKRIQLGCQVLEPDGSVSNRRLCEFYLQPNARVAQQSILARAKTMLQKRYQNEHEFRL